jgi:tRNA1Val (adenine37-N6)-methyltransferase
VRNEEITLDEARRFDLTIAQPASGYRFSLDALLLSDFAAPARAARIVDLGTGCGIIPLILCRRFPEATAVGIENNSQMAALAQANTRRNGLADRIIIVAGDITGAKALFPVSSFDGVICNPPFRTPGSGRISPKSGRDTARHESTASIADFLAAAKFLVKPEGRIWFVYLADRLTEFSHRAVELKLSLLRLRMVHGSAAAPAKMFLAELAKSRRGSTAVLPPLIIRGEDGTYTPEIMNILGEVR